MTTGGVKSTWAHQEEIPSTESPTIVLPSGNVKNSDTAAELFKRMAPSGKFFMRAGLVMELKKREDGILALVVLDPERARTTFEKFGDMKRWNKGELVPALYSSSLTKALLASEQAAALLPAVKWIISCPVMYEIGGKLKVALPGYHGDLALLVSGGIHVPEVPLEQAVKDIEGLFAEFDFQTEGDRARAIASLISPALKLGGFLKGRVPADVAEADQSQSGKTYRQKVIAEVYCERLYMVVLRKGGVGSLDESFGQALVTGRLFIQIDNVRGKLDSQFLESFLTAEGSFPCRVAYKAEVEIAPENFFIFVSSNGVDTTPDLANRSSIIRIRKKPEGHVFRRYPEGDLLAHVRANQPHFMGCIFAVIREWHRRGTPMTTEARHHFRNWVQSLDWIVQNIFTTVPLMDGHRESQQRVSNPDMGFLRSLAIALELSEGLGRVQQASDLAQTCLGEGIEIPGLSRHFDADEYTLQIGRVMKRLFRKSEIVEVDGFRVRRGSEDTKRQDNQGYYPTKTYTFERIGAKPSPPSRPGGAESKAVEAAKPNKFDKRQMLKVETDFK